MLDPACLVLHLLHLTANSKVRHSGKKKKKHFKIFFIGTGRDSHALKINKYHSASVTHNLAA